MMSFKLKVTRLNYRLQTGTSSFYIIPIACLLQHPLNVINYCLLPEMELLWFQTWLTFKSMTSWIGRLISFLSAACRSWLARPSINFSMGSFFNICRRLIFTRTRDGSLIFPTWWYEPDSNRYSLIHQTISNKSCVLYKYLCTCYF